jgi:hypothetical protein
MVQPWLVHSHINFDPIGTDETEIFMSQLETRLGHLGAVVERSGRTLSFRPSSSFARRLINQLGPIDKAEIEVDGDQGRICYEISAGRSLAQLSSLAVLAVVVAFSDRTYWDAIGGFLVVFGTFSLVTTCILPRFQIRSFLKSILEKSDVKTE